jgi:hypothetical protein
VERYSEPLGFVMKKIGHSVIGGVDKFYDNINNAIYW